VGSPARGVNVLQNPIFAPDNVLQLQPSAFGALDQFAAGNGTCPWADSQVFCGVDRNVLAVFNQYPHANIDSVGDLLNYRGYTFAGANPEKLNTYIMRLDYKITANGSYSLFLRGNLTIRPWRRNFLRSPPAIFIPATTRASPPDTQLFFVRL
jgi:hypothetical protein